MTLSTGSRGLFGAFAILLLPWGVNAQEQARRSLPLAVAVERALAQHPSTRAAAAGEAQARAALGEAQAARWPELQLRGSATQYQEPTLVSPIHGFQPGLAPPFDETLLQGTIAGRYRLFDAGGRRARIAQAAAQLEAAAASSRGAEDLLVAQVVSTYGRVLGRSRALEAHDHRLAALGAESGRVARLRDVGRAAEVEVLRIAAALETARAERIRIAAALEVAERDLARLTGVEADEARAAHLEAIALADPREPDREALARLALEASPALADARHRLGTLEAALDAAGSERWPQLEAVANGLGFGSAGGDFSSEWNAGIQLAYPLFNGGATGQRIARAQAARDVAAEQLRRAELDVRRELDEACSLLRESTARAASMETAIVRFAEVVRIEKLRLETGAGTQTDYLAAEADLLEARASLAELQYAAVAARIEIARVTGSLDRASLARLVTVKK